MKKISNDEISRLAENYADFWAIKDDKQNWMQVRSAFRSGMLQTLKIINSNSLAQTEAGRQFLKTSQTKENQQSTEQLLLKHDVIKSVCEKHQWHFFRVEKIRQCQVCGKMENY